MSQKCLSCFYQTANVFVLPCNHEIWCSKCFSQEQGNESRAERCPTCSENIESFKEVLVDAEPGAPTGTPEEIPEKKEKEHHDIREGEPEESAQEIRQEIRQGCETRAEATCIAARVITPPEVMIATPATVLTASTCASTSKKRKTTTTSEKKKKKKKKKTINITDETDGEELLEDADDIDQNALHAINQELLTRQKKRKAIGPEAIAYLKASFKLEEDLVADYKPEEEEEEEDEEEADEEDVDDEDDDDDDDDDVEEDEEEDEDFEPLPKKRKVSNKKEELRNKDACHVSKKLLTRLQEATNKYVGELPAKRTRRPPPAPLISTYKIPKSRPRKKKEVNKASDVEQVE